MKLKKFNEYINESASVKSLLRLIDLGLAEPELADRIEYNSNRYAHENAWESIRHRGSVPSHKLDTPFFFIYGGRADGASTGRHSGTKVMGSDFLANDSFAGMKELDQAEFTAELTGLFIDWLKDQPDEFFTGKVGLTGRPLFIRDETDALMGMQDWTPLR